MAGRSGAGIAMAAVALLLAGCDRVTNSPHPSGAEKTNTFFTAFQERSPKYLDPTASYSLDETPYTYSIFEPLYRYHALTREQLGNKRTPFDFEHQGSRELTAHDYVYGIKRLATTRIKSPSFSPMAEHIKGL